MALNLLSDQSDSGGDKQIQKTEKAPVDFRIPTPLTPPTPSIPPPVRPLAPKPIVPPPSTNPPAGGVVTGQATPKKETVAPTPVLAKKKSASNNDALTTPEALTKGFGVDLLLGGSNADVQQKSPTMILLMLVAAVVIPLTILGVWFGIRTTQQRSLQQTLATVEADMDVMAKSLQGVSDERTLLEGRLQNIDIARTLLATHTYWTRFFRFLEAVTIPDVYYTNLAIDPSGHIRLAAVGRDFSAVAHQLLSFEASQDVETVRMGKAAAEATGNISGVAFDLEITVKPSLLFSQ